MAAVTQIAILVALLAIVQWPLGTVMARAATSDRDTRIERAVYRVVGVDPRSEQTASAYVRAVVALCLVGVVVLTTILLVSPHLPWSGGTSGMPFAGALNTAVSFVTNTNWQWYSPEGTLGYAAQAVGLGVQNFVSAAMGIAVAFALARGIAAHRSHTLGNFWVDMTRITSRVLVPITMIATALLITGGVIDNLDSPRTVTGVAGNTQVIPGGPVATQEAIKQLGTNGGGFFNANAAHPFENPSAWTNLLSILLLLAIPFALPRTLGLILGSRRQGHAILGSMAALWLGSVAVLTWAETTGQGAAARLAGAAMEGKEVRFGPAASALYAASTTSTSTGSVNAAHDSLTPTGGLTAVSSMLLGEVSPGGVGSGLYGMLVVAILAVFLAGLMVGRTPEIYGKKVGAPEMKRVAVAILVTPLLVLAGTTATMAIPALRADAVTQPGPHGFTTALYAYASAANNNGSAFGSFDSSSTAQLLIMATVMAVGRIVPIVMVVSLAGRMAQQPRVEPGAGTMRTDTVLFSVLVAATAVIIALLTYAPVLALGPLAEALS